ncbi:MAG: hypothetical protein JSS89_01660 [Bacteroidetes bacterium]|nr:hypothetical protein [Bacteroidota bacterium]
MDKPPMVVKADRAVYITCTQTSEDSLTLSAIDATLQLVWSRRSIVPDPKARIVMGVRNNELSLYFISKKGDSSEIQRQNYTATTGALISDLTSVVRLSAKDGVNTVSDLRLTHGVLRSVDPMHDTVDTNGKEYQWQNYRLFPGTQGTHSPSFRLPVSRRLLKTSELVDGAMSTYAVVSIRDTIDDRPSSTPGRFIETAVVRGKDVRQFRTPIKDVFSDEKVEQITPYLGIQDTVLQLFTVAFTQGEGMQSLSHYEMFDATWRLKWSHVFGEEERENLDDVISWKRARPHGVYQVSNGTMLVLEEAVQMSSSGYWRPMYPPTWHYMTPLTPAFPTMYRHDAIMTATSLEQGLQSYSARKTMLVLIGNDGKIRWHSFLARDPVDADANHVMNDGTPDDGRVIVGTESKGSCPLLWRDHVNGALYVATLDLLTGVVSRPTNVANIDAKASWFGLSWVDEHTLMFFTKVSSRPNIVPVRIDLAKVVTP